MNVSSNLCRYQERPVTETQSRTYLAWVYVKIKQLVVWERYLCWEISFVQLDFQNCSSLETLDQLRREDKTMEVRTFRC